jgi:transcriptional regulator with XRE-family HTH domain
MRTADVAIFARNVAATRARQGLSQSQVSKRSGVHVTEVSRIERGLRDPKLSTIVRLARAMGVEPARLLDGISVPGRR